MEEPSTTSSPETAKPIAPGPVMDVVPPGRSASGGGSSAEPMAIAPPEEAGSKPQPPLPSASPKQQPKPDRPKPRAAGVNAAIFATVIIVFGLALMAVYAYLTQNK